jgi:hypothetical protein
MISSLKKHAAEIFGLLIALSVGVFAAIKAAQIRRMSAKANRTALDLAQDNARRARAQADDAQRAVDAAAARDIAAADDAAAKEASHAATTGDLAGYLNRRPKH